MLAAVVAIAAGPAAAATSASEHRFAIDDPVGDGLAGAGLDVQSAEIVHDREAGRIRAYLRFGQAAPGDTAGVRARLHLAVPTASGCGIAVGRAFEASFALYGSGVETGPDWQSGLFDWKLLGRAPVTIGFGTWRREGDLLVMETPADKEFTLQQFTCGGFVLERGDAGALTVLDEMWGGSTEVPAEPDPGTAGPNPATPRVPGGQPAPGTPVSNADLDRDGVPDRLDRCAQVPGAGADGCQTVTPARAVVLGTKRVVLDVLLTRSGAACPAKVSVKVKRGKKKAGSGRLAATPKGAFCHVKGVIRLKRKAPRKVKFRVAVTGTGVTSLGRNVKR